MEQGHIVVVGASVAGHSTAVVLRRAGYRVTLLERSATPLEDRGAGLVVDPAIISALTGKPVAQLVALPVVGRSLRTQKSDRVPDAVDLPAGFWATNWHQLHREVASAHDVAPRLGSRATAIAQDESGVDVTLGSGETIRADGVVLADGYDSTLRAVVDDEIQPEYSGKVLLRAIVPEDQLSPRIRDQVFDSRMHLYNRRPYYGVVYTVPGHGGALEVGRRSANLAIYTRAPIELMQQALRAQDGTLRNTVVGGRWAPGGREVLMPELDETWHAIWREIGTWAVEHDQLMASAVYAQVPTRLARGRVVLLGDCAHVASPITGSGSAAAMKDALALESSLTSTNGVVDAFACYEQSRLQEVQDFVDAGRLWSELFVRDGEYPPDPPVVLGKLLRLIDG